MKIKLRGKMLFNGLMIIISASLLIYFAVSENGLIDLLNSAAEFNKMWLFAGVLCHLLNILIDAYLIFRFTNNSQMGYSFINSFKASMVGQFFSAVTPGASGGQPMQVYTMTKQGVDIGRSTSALVQKFLVYQTTLTVYSGLSILFKMDLFRGEPIHVMRGLAIFGFLSQAFVIFVLLLFSFKKTLTHGIITFIFTWLGKTRLIKNPEESIRNVETQLVYFHESNHNLYKDQYLVFETYVFTVMQITSMFIVPYCIYRAFNLRGASVFDMIAAQSFVTMVSSFMPLPGGSGAAEGSFYVFFGLFFTESTIKGAVLLWRIITYFLTILISAPFSRLAKDGEGR